jgi:Flp pilus assembly protein TadG
MISWYKKLWRDKRGNALLIGAAVLPLIVGAAGLATDTIQWTLWKRQLQRAADSAAVSGVLTRLKSDTQTDVEASVSYDKGLNLKTWMTLKDAPTVERLSDTVDAKGNHVAMKPVRVTFRVQQALPFTSVFGFTPPVITAVSTAASVPDGAQYCVIGTDPSKNVSGITISGSTYLDLGDCSLIADSSNPNGALTNGTSSTKGNAGSGSTVKAASMAAVGNVNYSNNWTVGTYNSYSTGVADPFYDNYKNIPTSSSSCTTGKTNISIGGNSNIDRSSTDKAGEIVCMNGDQTIQKNVTLGPATYVINGGSLGMNSNNASLTCNGCTIIMTDFNSSGANTKTVNLTGGGLSLLPPRPILDSSGNPVLDSSGNPTYIGNKTWKGISIYQDPRATDNQSGASAQNKINGNTATSVQGVVYFGNQSLEFVGGGKDVAACLQVVAKRVTFSGNSLIKASSQCGAFGIGVIGGGRRVRIVA